jgi:hypothetical protein
MALINNQKFGITKWWLNCALETIQYDREIFRSSKAREAQKKFIAGSSVLKALKEWLLAAQIIQSASERGQYELTKFGRTIKQNDKNLENSSTWWAFHLSICFSERKEPYVSFFIALDNIGKSWVSLDSIKNQAAERLSRQSAEESVNSSLTGIVSMFDKDQPLADLGLVDVLQSDRQKSFRLGSPKINDEVFLHGLAMARTNLFATRTTVEFSELIKNNVHTYLCLSPEEFRKSLRSISRKDEWQKYFSFTEAVNLNSVFFSEHLKSTDTLLILLQNAKDSWL